VACWLPGTGKESILISLSIAWSFPPDMVEKKIASFD